MHLHFVSFHDPSRFLIVLMSFLALAKAICQGIAWQKPNPTKNESINKKVQYIKKRKCMCMIRAK